MKFIIAGILAFFSILIGLSSFTSREVSQENCNITFEPDSILNPEKIILGDWVLTRGRIFDSMLVLEKNPIIDPNRGNIPQFTFLSSTIIYSHYQPRPWRCGLGNFYINTSSWKSNGENIILLFDGGYSMTSNFIYECEYVIKSHSWSLVVLELKKVIKNEWSDYNGKHEEPPNRNRFTTE